MDARTENRIGWIVSQFRDVLQWNWIIDSIHGGFILIFRMTGREIVRVHLGSERAFWTLALKEQKTWLYNKIAFGLEDRKHGII